MLGKILKVQNNHSILVFCLFVSLFSWRTCSWHFLAEVFIKGTAASRISYWRESIHHIVYNENIGLRKKWFMLSTLKSGASRISHVKPCHSSRDCFQERQSRRIRLHVQMWFWERFQFVQSCITLLTGRLQNEPMFSGEVSFWKKLDVENRYKKKNLKRQPNQHKMSPEKQ